MRLGKTTLGLAVSACLALAAASVAANPAHGEETATATATATAREPAHVDLCAAAAEAAVDDARVLCGPGWSGWTARLDPPAPGTPDLTMTLVRTRANGARTVITRHLPGAAVWWPTIAPLERGARVENGELVIDVTRLGFGEYLVEQVRSGVAGS